MARFLLTVDSMVGTVRSASERMAAVEAMFAATKTRFLGKLTRDGEGHQKQRCTLARA